MQSHPQVIFIAIWREDSEPYDLYKSIRVEKTGGRERERGGRNLTIVFYKERESVRIQHQERSEMGWEFIKNSLKLHHTLGGGEEEVEGEKER